MKITFSSDAEADGVHVHAVERLLVGMCVDVLQDGNIVVDGVQVVAARDSGVSFHDMERLTLRWDEFDELRWC